MTSSTSILCIRGERVQHTTGRGVIGSFLIIVLVIALSLITQSWVSAENSIQPATAEPLPIETPVLDAPVIPEPAEPTIAPTEEHTPTPDAEPEPDPSPAPDAPYIPEPVPTEPDVETESEPVDDPPAPDESLQLTREDGTPEAVATISPESTAAPHSAITWSSIEPVSCQNTGENTASVAYAESQVWHCSAAIHVATDVVIPGDLAIMWTVDVAFPDAHVLSVTEDNAALISQQADVDVTRYHLEQVWHGGEVPHVAFDIEISRTTCAVGNQVLSVQATPEVTTSNAEVDIVQTGDAASAASYNISFAPNFIPPEVSMSAVDFGTLTWDGESWGSARATSTITVTNHHPCATSQAHTIDLHISATEGDLVPILVAVDIPGSELNAIEHGGTSSVMIPAGFTGSATIQVEFQLTPTVESPAGSYRFGFEINISPVP